MDKQLISILNLNSIKNISTFGFFNNYPILEYFVENDSELILGNSDNLWAQIISSFDIELSKLLSNYHKKTSFYYSAEDGMISLIKKYGRIDWTITTNRYVLEDNKHFESSDLRINIDKCFASFIYKNSNYKNLISIDYILERFSRDISAGLMIENKIVACGFTHDDRAF